MTGRVIGVALLLSILAIAGCGTVANLVCAPPAQGGKTPFGGVRQDVAYIDKASNTQPGCGPQPKSGTKQQAQVGLMLLGAADLPFSLVGDVVTLPYTAAYSVINQPIPLPPLTASLTQPPLQKIGEMPPQLSNKTSNPDTLPEPRQLTPTAPLDNLPDASKLP